MPLQVRAKRVDIPRPPLRPPFATYDLIVYFGGGLFSLPFIQHYLLTPFGIRFPTFHMSVDIAYGSAIVSTFVLIFSVYVLGHIIAFVASQFIEKPMESIFGKTSFIVYKTSHAPSANVGNLIRDEIRTALAAARRQSTVSSMALRIIVHLPVILFYIAAFRLRIFGFYVSRLPPVVFTAMKRNAEKLDIGDMEITGSTPWFKIIESFVVNNYPTPSARRYNHRVVSGLFRSMSLIFLAAIWCELIFAITYFLIEQPEVYNLITRTGTLPGWMFSLAMLIMVYGFSLYAYLKYQRRCVEEAILAFALTRTS